MCTGICYRGSRSCIHTNFKWWNWWKTWVFLSPLNPMLSTLFSHSIFYRSPAANYFVVSLIKSVGILIHIFQTPPSPPDLPTPQRVPKVWQQSIVVVKGTLAQYELWSLMPWAQILYFSSYQPCNSGQISLSFSIGKMGIVILRMCYNSWED